MAWPTRYELSHASIYWPAVFIDFVIATIVALLLRYVFFSEGNSVFSWADSLLSREDGPVDYSVTEPDQLDPSYIWDWGCLRDGFTVGPEIRDGKIYPHCPADGRSLGETIEPASISDIDNAIKRARVAQATWSETSFAQRCCVLRTLLKHILEHQDEIVRACCLDSGKTQVDACFGEILVTAEKLQWTIKHGEKALRSSRRPTNLLMCYKKNTVRYEPLGVVAACVSWNYPFHNFISPVISALFTGNAIVVKPSEQTCWSTQYFLNIIRGSLTACGHSGEVVQSVVCLPETANYLTSHSGLGHITFIGSREVAFRVCASAAKTLTPVTVELGGKDPAIVLDDPKTLKTMEDVCSVLLRGTFQSAGQNCIGIERVIAMPNAYERILQIVKPKIEAFRVGSATHTDHALDMGAMISGRSFDALESVIYAALEAGATCHCGSSRLNHPEYPNGFYFQPTLLSDITKNMEIAQKELFAPVFVLMRAEDKFQAVDIANSTSYGLGASIFGHNSADVEYCVKHIQAGMVAVNDFGAYYATSLPFGGVKGSGYGRFGGKEGLQGLCNVKAVCEDAWWAKLFGMQTKIPPPLQYPIVNRANAWQMCKGVVETGYAVSWNGRLQALVKLVRAMLPKSS